MVRSRIRLRQVLPIAMRQVIRHFTGCWHPQHRPRATVADAALYALVVSSCYRQRTRRRRARGPPCETVLSVQDPVGGVGAAMLNSDRRAQRAQPAVVDSGLAAAEPHFADDSRSEQQA